jgi:hypothetical protein
MMKIDSIGVYLVDVVDGVVNTSTKGFPQLAITFNVAQKYVQTPEEMAHFGIEEPAYVDYSSFQFQDSAFFTLFGKDGELLNYAQVQAAFGWDGVAFEDLPELTKGKRVLVRIEENEYNGKVSLRANWIDAADASPNRTLKALDTTALKALSAKFLTKKPPVKPAKPQGPTAVKANPTTVPTPKPAKPTTATTPPTGNPVSAPAPAKPATVAPAKAPTLPLQPPQVTQEADIPADLPKETTQGKAWEYVCEHKGSNTDDVIQDAWIAAGQEVADGRNDKDLTPTDWAKVRDIVIRDCKLV